MCVVHPHPKSLSSIMSLEQDQVRRAACALLKHVKSSTTGKPRLIEDEGEVVLAQISLHKIPSNVSAKPIPIAIPHPLRQREDCDMCLIVKDNAKTWIKEMVEAEPVEGLTKVLVSCLLAGLSFSTCFPPPSSSVRAPPLKAVTSSQNLIFF